MTKPRTSGFTLIEMLVVIVIVGIMLALTIPAVTTMMKSSGVSVATRQVSNTLGLARQLAITQRVYARVCFPHAATGSQQDMWYRTYAVMINPDNTIAANWKYASKWEYLPVGVVFLDSLPVGMGVLAPGSGALNDATCLNQSTPPATAGMPFPDAGGALSQLAYIEFAPSGSATGVPAGGFNPSVVTITEGFVAGNKPNPTSKASAVALANVGTLTVNSLVGRVQVTRP